MVLSDLLHPSFHYTMIYFTTFIFTLLLSHIARAMPPCGDVASPEELFDTYDDEQVLASYKVTWDATYDGNNIVSLYLSRSTH
jgi:hypothetical protein